MDPQKPVRDITIEELRQLAWDGLFTVVFYVVLLARFLHRSREAQLISRSAEEARCDSELVIKTIFPDERS